MIWNIIAQPNSTHSPNLFPPLSTPRSSPKFLPTISFQCPYHIPLPPPSQNPHTSTHQTRHDSFPPKKNPAFALHVAFFKSSEVSLPGDEQPNLRLTVAQHTLPPLSSLTTFFFWFPFKKSRAEQTRKKTVLHRLSFPLSIQ